MISLLLNRFCQDKRATMGALTEHKWIPFISLAVLIFIFCLAAPKIAESLVLWGVFPLVILAIVIQKFLTLWKSTESKKNDRLKAMVDQSSVSAILIILLTLFSLFAFMTDAKIYEAALNVIGSEKNVPDDSLDIISLHFVLFLACVGVYIVRAYLVVTNFDTGFYAGTTTLPDLVQENTKIFYLDFVVRVVIYFAVIWTMFVALPSKFGAKASALSLVYDRCPGVFPNFDCSVQAIKNTSDISAIHILEYFEKIIVPLFCLYLVTFFWSFIMSSFSKGKTGYKDIKPKLNSQLGAALFAGLALWFMKVSINYHLDESNSFLDKYLVHQNDETGDFTFLFSLCGIFVSICLLLYAIEKTYLSLVSFQKSNGS